MKETPEQFMEAFRFANKSAPLHIGDNMGTIYQCLTVDVRYTPPKHTLVHEAETESEAMLWLEQNGGGIYRNILHNFDVTIQPKKARA